MNLLRFLRRRIGVRLRSALAASAVVAVALLAASAAFVLATQATLTENLETAAAQRAQQVADALAAGNAAAAVRAGPGDPSLVQVIDAGGRVAWATASISGAPPLSALRPQVGDRETEQRRLPVADDDEFLVVALGTAAGTVVVAQPADAVGEAAEAVTESLPLGIPLLVLVAGTATFLFVGRALRPVEAMRERAATISASNLDARLPVPDVRDEIARLAATMNGMLDRIEAADRAQRRFVADASHELRSPLATIHAGLELLGGADLPDGARAQVTRLGTESTRMARLVDDLLLLARLSETARLRGTDRLGATARRGDVDLDDIVYAERDRLADRYPGVLISVRVEPVRVRGDAHHLHRAVRNLTDNAARHARAAITVTLTARAGTALLRVSDDGPGVPPADRDRIFDRFVRLDDSRSRDHGGTGLGLAITREIVLAHGGTIAAGEGDGGGARFEIRLPAA